MWPIGTIIQPALERDTCCDKNYIQKHGCDDLSTDYETATCALADGTSNFQHVSKYLAEVMVVDGIFNSSNTSLSILTTYSMEQSPSS